MLKMMLSLLGLLSMSLLAEGGEGEGGGTGEAGTGAGSGEGQNGSTGEGQTGEGGGEGASSGEGPTLEQEAQAAIQQLKDAGQEIPDALSKAVKELADARREAAGYRTGRNELRTEFDNLKTGLAKALGLDDGEDPPDPEALQAQLAERDATLKQQQVELAAFKAAGRHGANPDALLDSRSFLDKAAKLDPAAEDFTSKLDDTIKQALEANANLKATPGGGRNGGPAQGPRSGAGSAPKSLEESVAARLQNA